MSFKKPVDLHFFIVLKIIHFHHQDFFLLFYASIIIKFCIKIIINHTFWLYRPPVAIWILNCRYDCIPRVAKSLGYKIVRPNNIQVPNKSLIEFNYELRLANSRKQENDMWNLCWTDSLVAVDFCREMRRFQKINVSNF